MPSFPGDSGDKESTCSVGDLDLIPGLRQSPGEGHGNPLQYSCLGNPMERGAFSSVQLLSRVWLLGPQGLQHARPLSPSPTPRVYSNSCPLSQWCHPTILSSVTPFACLQSFLASGSFPMSQFFASDNQSIGVSASTSVLPMNTQDWSPLKSTGWISLQSKGLSKVFSNSTVQKYQFSSTQLSL